MPSRNRRRFAALGGIGPAPSAPAFTMITPRFLWCTKCFGKAESNYDGLVAAVPFQVDCEFDRLGSVLCRLCDRNHDACESVSLFRRREMSSLTNRSGSDRHCLGRHDFVGLAGSLRRDVRRDPLADHSARGSLRASLGLDHKTSVPWERGPGGHLRRSAEGAQVRKSA